MSDFRWREFVEDGDKRGSAARLNMVVGVAIGSIVVLYMTFTEKLTEGIFGIFMLATGGVYGWGKYRESVERVEQTKADSPNPPPQKVEQPAALGPTTIINTGSPPPEIPKGKTQNV